MNFTTKTSYLSLLFLFIGTTSHADIHCEAVATDGGCSGQIQAVEVQRVHPRREELRVVVDIVNAKGEKREIIFSRQDAKVGLSLIQSVGRKISPTSATADEIMSFSIK